MYEVVGIGRRIIYLRCVVFVYCVVDIDFSSDYSNLRRTAISIIK